MMKQFTTVKRGIAMLAFVLGGLAACAGPRLACAQAVTHDNVIDQWRALFPDQPYVCWRKKSSWDGLDRRQSPPAGVASLQTINVDMGRNEYESTSFVLTNLSDKAMTFAITCDEAGISTTLRKGVWVTLDEGTQVNDALSLIDDGRVDISAGDSLEIWMTLHGNDASPGTHHQTINVAPQGHAPHVVHVDVNVRDVSLPQRLPLDVFYWDEIVASWQSPQVTEAYMEQLKSHYVDYAFVHCWALPRLAVDSAGRLVTDYTEFDKTIKGYGPLDAKGYIFFWAANSMLEPSGDSPSARPEFKGRPPFMTPEWKALFRQWLTEWVAHLKALGISYDAFIMHPYDERSGPTVLATAKLIREVDPNIRIAFNGTVESAERAEAYAPYVDVWIPFLYHFLDAGGVNGYLSQTVKLEPNTTYTYSFHGKNGSASIYYDLIFNGSTQRLASALDAARWRQEQLTFTTASDTTQVELRFFPMVGNKTILIDDVTLCSSSGVNLVVNGDMESGSPPSGWATVSAEVTVNTTTPHAGHQCAAVLNIPSGDNTAKEATKRLFSQEKGTLWWTYANPPVSLPSKASPYHYYRVPVWRTWREGMTGFSVWTYKGGRWDSTGKGPNWGMVYRTDEADCPPQVSRQELVVPSKRWEACREGVEDYVYLHLLQSAIRKSDLPAASPQLVRAKHVLAFWTNEVIDRSDSDEAQLADTAKTQVMDAIVALAASR